MSTGRPRRPGFKPYEGLRAIVVDDDADVRRLVRHILGLEGANVDEAHTVDELFRLLENGEKPDVVMLDLTMPGASGWTALPRLRSGGDDVPVVIMTGYNDAEFRASAKARGAAAYVTKPFTALEVTSAVDVAIGRESRRDPWTGQSGGVDRSR